MNMESKQCALQVLSYCSSTVSKYLAPHVLCSLCLLVQQIPMSHFLSCCLDENIEFCFPWAYLHNFYVHNLDHNISFVVAGRLKTVYFYLDLWRVWWLFTSSTANSKGWREVSAYYLEKLLLLLLTGLVCDPLFMPYLRPTLKIVVTVASPHRRLSW